MATTKRSPAKKSTAKKAPAKKSGFDTSQFICNVVPSKNTATDWHYLDSIDSGAVGAPRALPASVDLRAPWWTINNQENTGSCVGWATADGVIRYHLANLGHFAVLSLINHIAEAIRADD